ncbi:hypothetical protein ACJMK2_041990 [Sinanodonta woodiana]|uniref:Mpv17-like protein 2 n=1 Tax=Sinanodonta woodiana TaxID=1069815 RepID=A0ABD3W958_SINWO
MNNLRKTIEKLFSKYLIVTNTISCGSLLAIGDVITQKVEQMDTGERKKHNWHRTGRMLSMGFVLGPFCHVWYGALDRFILGGGGKVAVKKILADQIVAAPFFCSAFFMGMSLLEGKTPQEGVQEVKDKFLMVYMVDWCVWPPCQFINFYFLPTQFRVLYVSSITLCWNTFLSWMKHRKIVH